MLTELGYDDLGRPAAFLGFPDSMFGGLQANLSAYKTPVELLLVRARGQQCALGERHWIGSPIPS